MIPDAHMERTGRVCIKVNLPPLEIFDFFNDMAAVKMNTGADSYEIVPCFYDDNLGNPENIYRLRYACDGVVVLSSMNPKKFHERMLPESKEDAVRLLYSAQREYNTG